LIDGYAALGAGEKQEALQTLLVRPATARELISAIGENRIPRAAITAPLARQLQAFKDPAIEAWLGSHWGAVRTTSADKQAQIAKFKEFLTTDLILQADASHGRAIFQQTCAVCHEMFGVGGKIGPELPGSFEDIDYLLQNILDPNAVIGKDYQQTFISLKNGQSVSGIIVAEDEQMVTLKTFSGVAAYPRPEITELQVSEQSMMPEGLLNALDEESVRDLFAYLRQRKQVPMLITPLTTSEFFNGNDLGAWRSSGSNWNVESGAIVGRSKGKAVSWLVSEMIGGDYKLTAQVRLSGTQATGELALRGTPGSGPFRGASLSFGRNMPVGVFRYKGSSPEAIHGSAVIKEGAWSNLEITAIGEVVRVMVNGTDAIEFNDAGASRTLPAFYLSGEDAELTIKDLKIEPLAKR
jgi:putative heme-binding domain-containing protein